MKIGDAAEVKHLEEEHFSASGILKGNKRKLTVSAWSIVALDESHIDGIVSIEKESFRQPRQCISFSNERACKDAIDIVVLEPSHGQIIAYAC